MSCLLVRSQVREQIQGGAKGRVLPGLYLKSCFPLLRYFGVTLGEQAYPKSMILIMKSETTMRLLGERSMWETQCFQRKRMQLEMCTSSRSLEVWLRNIFLLSVKSCRVSPFMKSIMRQFLYGKLFASLSQYLFKQTQDSSLKRLNISFSYLISAALNSSFFLEGTFITRTFPLACSDCPADRNLTGSKTKSIFLPFTKVFFFSSCTFKISTVLKIQLFQSASFFGKARSLQIDFGSIALRKG